MGIVIFSEQNKEKWKLLTETVITR